MIVQKIINKNLSIFFRFIIIIYGISLITTTENYYSLYWYFIILIPYLLIYFLTLFSDGFLSKIRLLNDFVLILFFAHGKGLDFALICFILLPLINSPNHTGDKKSILLYVICILTLFILNNYTFELSFFTCTLTIWLINFITESKSRFFNNVNKLNNEIESFFEREIEIKKSYKIYHGIIDSLNQINFLKFYKPYFDDIICFKIVNDNLNLENSSTFVWSYQTDKNLILENINNKDFIRHSNIPLKINNKEMSNNFIIINETNKSKYVFIFILDYKSNNIFNIYYINLLQSITLRISRVLDIENSIKNENKKILRIFRDKYFRIQNAEKAMHFIRNRLNTLDNFIEMSKDNISGGMDKNGMEIYKVELTRLERNFNLLMDRVKSILDKSEKPFSATQVELKSSNYLFDSVREIWLDYFNEFNHELNWKIEGLDKFKTAINNDGLYILLTDWISNLKSHSEGSEKVLFNEDNENLEIIFKNKFNSKQEEEILTLKEDFNSKDKDRILKRTSHGVITMKSILEEMSVIGRIEVEDYTLKLILLFKKEYNENCNI